MEPMEPLVAICARAPKRADASARISGAMIMSAGPPGLSPMTSSRNCAHGKERYTGARSAPRYEMLLSSASAGGSVVHANLVTHFCRLIGLRCSERVQHYSERRQSAHLFSKLSEERGDSFLI